MKRLSTLVLWVGVSLAPAACARQVNEIPITTSSQEALADFEKGQWLLDVGRPQEANARFRSAVERDPNFSYAYLNIANSAASTTEFKENLNLAMEHIDGKSDGERLLIEINETFLEGDVEKRIELAEEMAGLYPGSPRAWLALSGAQASRNEHEAARQSIRRALELDADLYTAHAALGFSYLFNNPKNFMRARESMEMLIEIAPDEAKGYENVGDVYRAMKQLEEAREWYTRATEKDPTLSVASLKQGHVNSFLGNLEEARAAYDVGVHGAKEGNIASYANYRAFVNLHAGDARAALEELSEILHSIERVDIPESQIPGVMTFTLSNQATIALHNNMLHDAEEIVERLAAAMRANAERVGDLNFTRQQEAAIRLWQGQLAARKGDFETAVAKAAENRELREPDNNERKLEGYHGVLGLTELLQGNYAEAVEHYKRANLNVMYVKYHLGLAEEGVGNAEEARRIFEEVSQWNFNSVGFALVRKDAMARANAT